MFFIVEEKQLKQVLQDLEKCDSISPSAYESLLDNFDVYPHDDYQRMYYTIGYNGEYDELLEKIYDVKENQIPYTTEILSDLMNEGGDVCWYGTRLTNAFNFTLKQVLPQPKQHVTYTYDHLMKKVHKSKKDLTESVKKFYRDARGNMTPEWEIRLLDCLREFFEWLQNLGVYYRMTLSDMMRANILKLGNRKLEDKLHGDGDKR